MKGGTQDPKGGQVADLLAYNLQDVLEVISSGRSLDYGETISLTTGHHLFSNRSRVMPIIHNSVGRHDFLLTRCSIDTFLPFYPDLEPHRGCFGNFAEALTPCGIGPDAIPVVFNCLTCRSTR